jgi:hypothetical protein
MDKDLTSHRIKKYQFSIATFTDMFKTGNEIAVRIKKGWPKDAVIVGLHSDERSYSFTVLVESKEFPVVKPKEEIHSGEIHFEELDDPAWKAVKAALITNSWTENGE